MADQDQIQQQVVADIRKLKAIILGAEQQYLGQTATDVINCILVLIAFFLANPLLLTVFISFLESIKASIELEKEELQLIVAQSEVVLATLHTEVAALVALVNAVLSLGGKLPLQQLLACKFFQQLVAAVTQGIPGSFTSGFISTIGSIQKEIKNLNYQIALLQQKIDSFNQQIEQFTLFSQIIDAIIQILNDAAGLNKSILTLPG